MAQARAMAQTEPETMGFLPGSVVPLEWTNGVLRRWLKTGFHLRIDTANVYLCYGHEDVVDVLPRFNGPRLASQRLCALIKDDLRRRFLKGDALRAQVNHVSEALKNTRDIPDDGKTDGRAPIAAVPVGGGGGFYLKIIPPSLVRCYVCGDYRGEAKWNELDHNPNSFREDPEMIVSFTCLCQGIPCGRCKRNLIYRPISNTYNPKPNGLEHVPYFCGMMPCRECRKKEDGTE